MKKKKFTPGLIYLIFTALFFFGFQQSIEAQFRIANNTSCTVNFKVGQQNSLTAVCSLCNPSGIISLPPGASYIHPALNSCGPEYWLAFKYYLSNATTPVGSTGVSFNPGLGGACGSDANAICNGSPVTANWFLTSASGAGPVTVILN